MGLLYKFSWSNYIIFETAITKNDFTTKINFDRLINVNRNHYYLENGEY